MLIIKKSPVDVTIASLQSLIYQVGNIFVPDRDSIIAGGAPRDLLNDKPVKDIDVFIRINKETGNLDLDPESGEKLAEEEQRFAKDCKMLAWAIGGECQFIAAPDEYGNIVDFCNLTGSIYTLPIQIVGVPEAPLVDMYNYDFGLSKVAIHEGGVLYTDDYMRDVTLGCITYTPMLDGAIVNFAAIDLKAKLRSKKRLARLREKYGDWYFGNVELLDELPEELPPEFDSTVYRDYL